MNILSRTAAALMVAAAIGGASGEWSSAAAATPPAVGGATGLATPIDDDVAGDDEEMGAAASRGVDVLNMSGDTMRLRSIVGDQWFEGRPADGAQIAPGGVHRWEMQLQYMRYNNETVTYDLFRPDGSYDGSVTFHMKLYTDLIGDVAQTTDCTGISSSDGVTCSASKYLVTLTDRAGTVRDLDGSGPNPVAIDVLQGLCDTGKATCEFQATSQEKTWGPMKPMGTPLGNVTDLNQSKSVTVSDSWASSDSLGGSASLKVPIGPVELTLQATYNHTWTTTHLFGETVTVETPPFHWGWVEQRAPYVRHVGTFVVTYGNTVWRIKDVAIDSPDASRQAVTIVQAAPMTQQEIDDIRKDPPTTLDGFVAGTPSSSVHLVDAG